MPITPRLTTRQVAVRPDSTPYQTGRGATQEAFGSGRGLASLASGLDAVAQVSTNIGLQDIEREASEADVRYTAERRRILYGDADNPGYYSLKGQAALDASPTVEKQLRETREKINQELRSENAKRLFGQASAVRLEGDLKGMGSYTLEQRTVANNTVSQARVKEAIDDAALGWNNPTVLNQSQAIIENEVHRQAEFNGWVPEVTNSKLQEARTLLFRNTVITALKQNKVAEARELFNTYKGQMDAPVAAEVEEMLRQGTMRAEAQAETATILATGADATEMRAMARAIKNPELQDEVLARVNRRIAEMDQERKAAEESAASSAYEALFSGQQLDQFQSENPELFALIVRDGGTMSNLLRIQDMVSEGRNFSRVDDPEKIQEFDKLDTAQKANVDLRAYQPYVTQSAWNDMRRAQQAAQSLLGDDAKARANHSFAQNLLRDYADKAVKGWDKEKRAQEYIDLQNTLSSQMGAFVQQSLEKDGSPPTEQEIRKEAERLTTVVEGVTGTRPDGYLNSLLDTIGISREAYAAELANMTPEEKAEARVPVEDIPASLRTDIEAVFQKYGVTATDELLEQYTGAFLANDVARQRRLLRPGEVTVPLQ